VVEVVISLLPANERKPLRLFVIHEESFQCFHLFVDFYESTNQKENKFYRQTSVGKTKNLQINIVQRGTFGLVLIFN